MAAAVHSAAFAFKWPPSANQSTTSDGAMLAAFPLAGQLVGLKEVEDGIWLVSFMHYDLGYIDLEQKTFQPIDNPFGTRLSPISQEQVVTCVSGSDDRPLGGEGVRQILDPQRCTSCPNTLNLLHPLPEMRYRRSNTFHKGAPPHVGWIVG
jgi:hypothetical protein